MNRCRQYMKKGYASYITLQIQDSGYICNSDFEVKQVKQKRGSGPILKLMAYWREKSGVLFHGRI